MPFINHCLGNGSGEGSGSGGESGSGSGNETGMYALFVIKSILCIMV